MTELLTAEETGIVASYVRMGIRKIEKSRRDLSRKFGDEVDLANMNVRLALLESAYQKLTGKNPTDVSNRKQHLRSSTPCP